MKLEVGRKAPDFEIKSLDGAVYNLKMMTGKKFMLSFYRYASCPFCNLRVSFLMDLHKRLNLDNQMIGIFQSNEEDMMTYVGRLSPEFPIGSDYERKYYKAYGVDTSLMAYIIGAMRLNTLLKAYKKGFHISRSMGPRTTVPADFLIDEKGIITDAYYGHDISDHLDLEIVEEFFSAQ
ncbi:MAG: redoxin family protein [Clostridiales bacterium]|nr:redoxin family protein [Clostridiales bacterium]